MGKIIKKSIFIIIEKEIIINKELFICILNNYY